MFKSRLFLVRSFSLPSPFSRAFGTFFIAVIHPLLSLASVYPKLCSSRVSDPLSIQIFPIFHNSLTPRRLSVLCTHALYATLG